MSSTLRICSLFGVGFLLLLGCGESKKVLEGKEPAGEEKPLSELDKEFPCRPRLGMNLGAVTEYSTELSMVDVFKASKPWMKEENEELSLNLDGYPRLRRGQTTATLMLREIGGHYPRGKYVATYQGKGKVEMSQYDVTEVVKDSPGRIESEVRPGEGGIELKILESDPADPIRDIHVWMPGFEKAKSPFHPTFLKRLEPFGVFRFMDWQQTNKSTLKKWSDRPRMSDARYSSEKGVPVELMVELANAQLIHPWFCMPHQADDDFVRGFASLVKDRLDPRLRVYVEYSNEVWNWSFDQTQWAKEQGKKLGLGDPDHHRFYAQRSLEIFKIWEEVFTDRKRLVRVLGAQFANPWTSEQILSWKDAYKNADALAVAPYFGNEHGDPENAGKSAKLTENQLLDALEKEIDGPNRETILKQVAMARKFKVPLIAYEGGQHLVGYNGAENNEQLAKLFLAANRNPRMGQLYKKHLKHWFEAGGGLFVVFANTGGFGKWGSWGVLEYQDQPVEQAPKYQALVEFAKGELPKAK